MFVKLYYTHGCINQNTKSVFGLSWMTRTITNLQKTLRKYDGYEIDVMFLESRIIALNLSD